MLGLMTPVMLHIIWGFLFSLSSTIKPSDDPVFTLYIFEGSDWCVNCWRLEKTVLQDTSFRQQLEKLDVSIEKIDFPQKNQQPERTKQYNNSIAEKYDFDGSFPTLVIAKKGTASFQKIRYYNQSGRELLEELKQKMQKLE
jgi:thioredoxin-related protein